MLATWIKVSAYKKTCQIALCSYISKRFKYSSSSSVNLYQRARLLKGVAERWIHCPWGRLKLATVRPRRHEDNQLNTITIIILYHKNLVDMTIKYRSVFVISVGSYMPAITEHLSTHFSRCWFPVHIPLWSSYVCSAATSSSLVCRSDNFCSQYYNSVCFFSFWSILGRKFIERLRP